MRKGAKIAAILVASVLVSACDSLGGEKQTMGTAIGGAGGAAIGSQFGKGHGRLVTTALGAIFGAAVGNEVGRNLDDVDKMKASQAFQQAANSHLGSSIRWNNPNTGNSGIVVPLRDGRSSNGEYCREFQQTITVAGKQQTAYGTACRQQDGQWRIIE